MDRMVDNESGRQRTPRSSKRLLSGQYGRGDYGDHQNSLAMFSKQLEEDYQRDEAA